MVSRFPVNLIDNKFIPFLSRVILGGIFIYAAVGKILYPADFSEAITNYQLVPVMFTNLIAIVLPWVELVAGILLLNGFRTQSGNVIIFLMVCVFSFGVTHFTSIIISVSILDVSVSVNIGVSAIFLCFFSVSVSVIFSYTFNICWWYYFQFLCFL